MSTPPTLQWSMAHFYLIFGGVCAPRVRLFALQIHDDDDDDDDVAGTDEWGEGGRGRLRFLTFDGENWVMYDLSRLPDAYRHINTRESVELAFQTNGPDGLIWFTGSEQENIQLALRVCMPGPKKRSFFSKKF